jgi:hypothetical protein
MILLQKYKKIAFIIFGLIVLGIFVFIMSYMSLNPKRIAIARGQGNLNYLLSSWILDGSIRLSNVSSLNSSEKFFIFTNSYLIGGRMRQCRFAMNSTQFGTSGFVAITTEKDLLWIDPTGQPKIILKSKIPPIAN